MQTTFSLLALSRLTFTNYFTFLKKNSNGMKTSVRCVTIFAIKIFGYPYRDEYFNHGQRALYNVYMYHERMNENDLMCFGRHILI